MVYHLFDKTPSLGIGQLLMFGDGSLVNACSLSTKPVRWSAADVSGWFIGDRSPRIRRNPFIGLMLMFRDGPLVNAYRSPGIRQDQFIGQLLFRYGSLVNAYHIFHKTINRKSRTDVSGWFFDQRLPPFL